MRNSVRPLVLTLLLFAGCASGDWHWTDPGVHVVAGSWVTEEVSCELDAPDMCGLALRAARDWVHTTDLTVRIASGRWAQWPRDWIDSGGHKHFNANGSLFASSVAILTLGSGEVRLVGLLCGPDLRMDAVDRPTVCSGGGLVGGEYSVGAPPPPVLGR